MKSLPFYILIISSTIYLVNSLSLDEVIHKSKREIEDELMEQMKLGATSVKSRYKKSTPLSRAMAERNSLYRRSVELGSLHGYKEEQLRHRFKRSNIRFKPPGHGRKSDTKTINLVCDESNVPDCSSASNEYRTIDGSCNNKKNGAYGMAFTKMIREKKAIYGDDLGALPTGGFPNFNNRKKRRSKDGKDGKNQKDGKDGKDEKDCPKKNARVVRNAREISMKIHPDEDHTSTSVTHMVTQMGQFLDHDITLTPENHGEHCCEANNEHCFAIKVSETDSFYKTVGVNCIEFSRSTQFCAENGGVREQINGITSFIDASNVYGSEIEEADILRTKTDGKLRVSNIGNWEMLPFVDSAYKAGDVRAIEMPGLATMHTLFLREHNRLAELIKAKNGALSDEQIYQIARKIVGAEMQNVVYGQYLPVVLGDDVMKSYKLGVSSSKTEYDENAKPIITNEFATAAYRFGHSMIQGMISMINYVTKSSTTFPLRDNYFLMTNYNNTFGGVLGMHQILMGLITQGAQENDQFVTEDTTNFLFKEATASFGGDLVARNIQRGRDHGLAGYNAYRQMCDSSELCSWDKKPDDIDEDNWKALEELYDNPDDIDLFTAGLVEKPYKGGLTGKTFNCLKARQFKNLKFGDRFFYTHKGVFTDDQLANLLKRNLGDIICDNSDLIKTKNNVFLVNSGDLNCNQRANLHIDLFVK